MIGNDIVDWAQAKRESDWQRKGFIAKLFTYEEQQLIHEADNPEQVVWVLWCLKESVYKANVRLTGKRRFAPQKIVCQLNTWQHDVVEGTAFYDQHYQVRASLTPDYVAGIAFLEEIPPVFREVILAFDGMARLHPSTHLYQRVRQDCALTLSAPIDTIYVHKDALGAPALFITHPSNKPVTIPISLSHHGQYGAFLIDYSACAVVTFSERFYPNFPTNCR